MPRKQQLMFVDREEYERNREKYGEPESARFDNGQLKGYNVPMYSQDGK